ncbi:MAG: HEAT repeat domain-containing protein, partial [Planctomycetota bacterium]
MRHTPTNGPLRAATFLLCSVGSIVLASQVRAQDAAPEAAQETSAAVSTELDRKRLLTLADGTVLRVRSRTQDGVWQQRVGRDWLPLTARVVSHRLEREVLAEARRLEKPIERKDHRQRAELARWLAEQGLHPEALSQLDRILGAEPDHEGALRVVSETPIELELPPEAERDLALRLKALVKTGASGSRATREVAVHQLRELGFSERGERVDLRRVIEVELTAPQYRRRQFAAFAARRLYPGEMRRKLATRSILDSWEDVREEASSALRAAEDVSVIGPALYALGSENANVRANAAAALGSMGYEAAVQPLMNHLAAAAQSSGGAPSGVRANLLVGLQTAYVMD